MPSVLQYSETGCTETTHTGFADLWTNRPATGLTWINMEQSETEAFQQLSTTLDLHPLLVEDIHSKAQLPKFEPFDNLSFLSIQMVRTRAITQEIFTEHLSILVGDNFIITLQDNKEGDVFDNLRQKIRNGYKRLYKNGIDYLFLSMVDAVVDEYLAVLNRLRIPVEDMEITMVRRPQLNFIPKILELKSELNHLRKFTTPLREEMQRIRIENPELIRKTNQALFRDILDHLNTLNSNFDSLRELLRDLSDLHQSNQNLVLGNTMKTLTVISAIFIPLTFIVGVYGMNFDNMPWLHSNYGFWLISGFMLLLTGALVYYMRRRKWF